LEGFESRPGVIFIHLNSENKMISIGANYTILLAQPYPKDAAKLTSVNVADSLKDALKAQQDAYLKRWDDARQAIARLNVGTQSAAQLAKAAAADKVKRIKDQIKMLMMIGGVGDPKANARQIVQLAKELASAAHEYASAGGGGESGNTIAPANVVTPGGNASSSQSGATADATAAMSSVTVPMGVSGNAAAASTAGVTTGSGQDSSKQQIKDGAQNLIAGLYQKSSGSDADREFIKDVRDLAAKLKALLKQQEARLHQAGDLTADGDISKINQVVGEIEKSVSSIDLPVMAAPSTVNIFA
jgi:hypothetical protein